MKEELMKEEIQNLQANMLIIRKLLGWSAPEFGEKIGVTRQSINNLERFNSPRSIMTKTQYVAIRTILDLEFKKDPEGALAVMLLLYILVDHRKDFDDVGNYDKNTLTDLRKFFLCESHKYDAYATYVNQYEARRLTSKSVKEQLVHDDILASIKVSEIVAENNMEIKFWQTKL